MVARKVGTWKECRVCVRETCMCEKVECDDGRLRYCRDSDSEKKEKKRTRGRVIARPGSCVVPRAVDTVCVCATRVSFSSHMVKAQPKGNEQARLTLPLFFLGSSLMLV